MLAGEPPYMSERISTPSPSSSSFTSLRASGSICRGSSCAVMLSCLSRGGRRFSSWLAQWMRLSPSVPCEMIRIPIMKGASNPVNETAIVYSFALQHAAAPAARKRRSANRLLQRVQEHAGDVEAGLLGDFLEAGGTGDVDLGQPVADHVQPGEEHPFLREHGAKRVRDLAVALR